MSSDDSTALMRDPVHRLQHLFDAGSVRLLHPPDSSGVLAARGTVDAIPTIAYASDPSVMGGAIGATGCRHIVRAITTARTERCPVVGLWHSGGARLADGAEALDGIGRVFTATVQASGRIPQLSVVLGPAAGGAAYGSALTDIVIMAPEGRVFVTGPDVVRSVTGEDVDMAALGGPDTHTRRSGVAHIGARDAADAFARARRLVTLLAAQGRVDGSAEVVDADLSTLLPDQPQRAYDVRPLVRAILDPDPEGRPALEELQARWAANIVTGFGRLGGRTVGVIANNPLRKGGCLDSLSAEKAARFVRLCDAFGVPLLVVVDVPGYLPGVDQEWDGVVRRGAKLLHAFAEARVTRITLVTRKAYGGAYIAMNSRSLGATAVFAWPDAQLSVMGAEAAVGILHRRQLAAASSQDRPALLAELIATHERTVGGVARALDLGAVDEIVEPAKTRRKLIEVLALAPDVRGDHTNIPL